MTPNQKISKTREELNAMADRCRDMAEDLEELADGLSILSMADVAASSEPLQGFEAVSRMLHEGQRPPLGQVILTALTDGRVAKWRVIDSTRMAQQLGSGVRPIVAQLAEILDYRPFSRPDKAHPWGWNNYEASELAAWLDDVFARELMRDEDFGCLVGRTDIGGKRRHVWLLSEEEAGYDDLEKAFAWYACEDEEEREKRRKLTDSDGDAAHWWLRTPYSGAASIVRYVYTDGSLNYSNYAHSARGVAPACIIG